MNLLKTTTNLQLEKPILTTTQNRRKAQIARLKEPRIMQWIVLVGLALVWGSSFIQIKKALLVFSPTQISSLRISVAFLFLASFGWIYLRQIPVKKLKYTFLAGFLGVFAPGFLFPLAQQGVSSSLVGVLNGFTPVCTWLVGLLIFGQRISNFKMGGLLVGLVGAIGLTILNAKGTLEFNLFALFALTAAFANGLYLNLVKKHLGELPSMPVAIVSILMIGPLAMSILLSTNVVHTYQNTEGSAIALISVIFLGLVATALSLIAFNYLLQIANPIFASSVSYLMPIVAIMWGLLDGEEISFAQSLGIVAIIAGIYILNKKEKIVMSE